MDNGSTATYTYDALNQRVRMDFGGSSQEFIFNPAGQHTSTMDVVNHWEEEGKAYWGSSPLAVYVGGTTQFEHQDWLGTERTRTNVSGSTAGSYTSLPFGDGYNVSGNDWDAYHFAGMDQDTASNDHAQFRGYSNMSGRWMSPDPYDGSYDPINPQSLNRYAYVMNSPLSFLDPLGLDHYYIDADGCLDFVWSVSSHDAQGNITSENYGTSYCGNGSAGNISIGGMTYGGSGGAGGGGAGAPNKGSNTSDQWPFNGNLLPLTPQRQDDRCTTGPLSGPMNSDPLIKSCCQAHDNCYAAHGCNATSWIPNPLPWGACNTCNLKAASCINNALPLTFIP